ncbi:periplasmic chaperone for outer membrane proteins Skp [Sphingomonas laterariae]|uniref:Periplasmic chaperone for outer membrane proteins Skp n=1 Tax=Edaphosphingomonas laterariae TaxID=861865 RepID=A0A239EWR9_9SPHN|nr:OmpH family outer membrane protein [Sphingomonas laterariae]SNS49065.1 periplasmic chaperone for outer membrane proteins Skp [Sphingomonas laterariae]
MKTILKAVATAAVIAAVPGVASAQKAPGAVIVTIDTQKVYADCNACKAAQTQLQTQAQQIQQLAQSLGQPIQTEAEAIQKAAGGKAPDAALQARIQALETKQTAANQQLQQRQQQFQRNRAYVAQQIGQKLNPIISQVMTARGANLAVDTGATLAASSSLDVTNDVLAQLNTQLPSVSTTAPAAPAPASR